MHFSTIERARKLTVCGARAFVPPGIYINQKVHKNRLDFMCVRVMSVLLLDISNNRRYTRPPTLSERGVIVKEFILNPGATMHSRMMRGPASRPPDPSVCLLAHSSEQQ